MSLCPCGTGKKIGECCGIYLSCEANAPTPEALMRSRYTAYNRVDLDYIEKTMKSPAADHFNRNDALSRAEKIRWVKLEVIKTDGNAEKGFVEFRAHYCVGDKTFILHETSEFRCDEGEWYYVDGVQHPC
jgi:SEC-C motif-containing protein